MTTPPATLTLTLDLSASPPSLKIVGNYTRAVKLTVTDRGVTASATAIYPLQVTDDSGKVWTKKSDDGVTALYTG